MEKVSWSVLCLDFSCVANCYLHKGKKEECVSNLVCLIIAQPKILKSGPCRLEALYISICLWSKKKFESYFRDRLTFSNIDSRTSRRIYRLALLLRAPETLSSLSKSRISIFNAHLTLLVRKMTSHNSIGKYRHLVN